MTKLLSLIPSVHAATGTTVDIGTPATSGNFFGFTCIWNIVSNLTSVVFILGGIAFFVMLVLGGLEWSMSSGDKVKVENAQKKITNALIGLAIIASSWAIYLLVLDFFGIDISQICSDNPTGI